MLKLPKDKFFYIRRYLFGQYHDTTMSKHLNKEGNMKAKKQFI